MMFASSGIPYQWQHIDTVVNGRNNAFMMNVIGENDIRFILVNGGFLIEGKASYTYKIKKEIE